MVGEFRTVEIVDASDGLGRWVGGAVPAYLSEPSPAGDRTLALEHWEGALMTIVDRRALFGLDLGFGISVPCVIDQEGRQAVGWVTLRGA